MARGWKFYWLLVVAMFAVYFTMVFWSLPTISAQAGGLVPFDMRPTGYSYEDAQAFLTALSDEGAQFYLRVQHSMDFAYPAMLALVLAIGLWRQMRGWPRVLAAGIAALPVIGSASDYMENFAVAGMLRAGANGVTAEMVAHASQWTLIKSGATTIAMLALLGLLIWAAIKKFLR